MVGNNKDLSGCIPTNFKNAIFLESCGVAYTALECCNSLISSVCDGELTCSKLFPTVYFINFYLPFLLGFTAPPQIPPRAPTSYDTPVAPVDTVPISPIYNTPTISRNFNSAEKSTSVAVGAAIVMLVLPLIL